MRPNDTAFMLARCRKLALEAMLTVALPPPPPLPPRARSARGARQRSAPCPPTLPSPRARSAEDVAELPDDVAAAHLQPRVACVLARLCRRLEARPITLAPALRFVPVAPGGRGSR